MALRYQFQSFIEEAIEALSHFRKTQKNRPEHSWGIPPAPWGNRSLQTYIYNLFMDRKSPSKMPIQTQKLTSHSILDNQFEYNVNNSPVMKKAFESIEKNTDNALSEPGSSCPSVSSSSLPQHKEPGPHQIVAQTVARIHAQYNLLRYQRGFLCYHNTGSGKTVSILSIIVGL